MILHKKWGKTSPKEQLKTQVLLTHRHCHMSEALVSIIVLYVPSDRWVHFPRAVLFCQPHQQLFTHSLDLSQRQGTVTQRRLWNGIAERLKAKRCGLVDLLHRQETATQERLWDAIAETEGKKLQWSLPEARDCYPRKTEMESQRDWRQKGTVGLISSTGKRLLPKRDSEKSSTDWRQKPQWALPEATDCYLRKAVKWNLRKTEGKRVRLGWSPTQARDRYPRETQRCNGRDWRQKGAVWLIYTVQARYHYPSETQQCNSRDWLRKGAALPEAIDCYPRKALKWNIRETEGKRVWSG